MCVMGGAAIFGPSCSRFVATSEHTFDIVPIGICIMLYQLSSGCVSNIFYVDMDYREQVKAGQAVSDSPSLIANK